MIGFIGDLAIGLLVSSTVGAALDAHKTRSSRAKRVEHKPGCAWGRSWCDCGATWGTDYREKKGGL